VGAAGGVIRTASRVSAILLDRDVVRGVELEDGTRFDAPRVVVACDPTVAFVQWLRPRGARAEQLARRWAQRPHRDGYESKLDAVVGELPTLRGIDRAHGDALGVTEAWLPTTIVAPSIDGIAQAHRAMNHGQVARRPMLFVNIPSVADPTLRVGGSNGDHVLSLEVLFTPYELRGGWGASTEPERWLDCLGALVEPGFRDAIRRWRVMTPPRYEAEFSLRRGHAPSFAGGAVAALLGRDRELTRYETPIAGLYLTGAATFPGAGVWGASGRNTAAVVLRGPRRPRVTGIAAVRRPTRTTRVPA
jgi:phytoene dehydrogenase-like protein